VRIFEKSEAWDTTKNSVQTFTTQGIATIQLASGPLSIDGARWHLIKHVLGDSETNPLGPNIQSELTQQLSLDRDRKTIDISLGNYFQQSKKYSRLPHFKGILPSPFHPSSRMHGEATRGSGERRP